MKYDRGLRAFLRALRRKARDKVTPFFMLIQKFVLLTAVLFYACGNLLIFLRGGKSEVSDGS